MLKQGEILPSVDVDTEIELTANEKLNTMVSLPAEEEEETELPEEPVTE